MKKKNNNKESCSYSAVRDLLYLLSDAGQASSLCAERRVFPGPKQGFGAVKTARTYHINEQQEGAAAHEQTSWQEEGWGVGIEQVSDHFLQLGHSLASSLTPCP